MSPIYLENGTKSIENQCALSNEQRREKMSQNVCRTLTHYPEMSEMACLKNHTILLQISVVVQPACYPSPLLLLLLFLLLQLLPTTIKVSQCKLLSRLLCHRLLPNFFEQSSEIRHITRPPFPRAFFFHALWRNTLKLNFKQFCKISPTYLQFQKRQ